MLLKSVSIKNFRCLKDLTVEFADLTAFVGRNGSGKSTTLHALNAFYNIKAPVSEDDFFNRDTSTPIEITVEYRDLVPDELVEFSSFVDDGTFAVTKRISSDDGKLEQRYFAATRQIPQISEIRSLTGVIKKRSAWNALVDKEEFPEIGPRSVRGDDPDEIMDEYEQSHPELAEWIPQEFQFLGPPNIGGGKLDNYTKFVYIPAVRDASDDSIDKKGSPLFQLLDFVVMRRFRARQDVRELEEQFADRLKDLYDPSKLTEFGELAADISRTLQVYIPNTQLELRVEQPSLPSIPSPATIAELTEDEFVGSIDRKGHGLQRALIFALLQHLAITQPIEPEEESEESDETTNETQTEVAGANENKLEPSHEPLGPDLIIAIEEPELYQHPLRAKHLSRILLDMSRESSLGPGGRNQIVYTTHSPYFVDLERFSQLRIMQKRKQADGEPPCTSVASYSLESAAEKMATLTGKPKEDFSADSFRVRAYPVMTQIVNEGFFADAIVLVEGDTEAAALHAVANHLDSNWLSKGIAVVPVGGKTKIDRAAVIFSGLEIPTYIVFDGDSRHRGTKNETKEASTNHLLLRLCGAVEEDFPSDTADDIYACFEDDFEAYCKKEIGEKEYETLREAAANAHGYTKPTDGIKNFDVVVELVSAIYEKGQQLPLLERIVAQVNRLLERTPISDNSAVASEDSA